VHIIFRGKDFSMSDRWMSVEEISEHLGVSKDTVYAWIAKKNMPAHRVGRFWKFQKSAVDQWIKTDGANDAAHGDNGEDKV
jgi:excisionase family DNA binding protein